MLIWSWYEDRALWVTLILLPDKKIKCLPFSSDCNNNTRKAGNLNTLHLEAPMKIMCLDTHFKAKCLHKINILNFMNYPVWDSFLSIWKCVPDFLFFLTGSSKYYYLPHSYNNNCLQIADAILFPFLIKLFDLNGSLRILHSSKPS